MPAYNFIDLTGQIFGRLNIVERAENSENKHSCWKCLCSCGNIVIVRSCNLKSGATRSCGCLKDEARQKHWEKHGLSGIPEYKIWNGIIQRCENPKATKFKNYGGRSITVCDEWRNDFVAFFKDMGPRPSPKHSIERINNDGNYEPVNCVWATASEQMNNNRHNHWLTINGETHTIMQWAKIVKIKPARLYQRIYKGLSPEQAICQPVRHVT